MGICVISSNLCFSVFVYPTDAQTLLWNRLAVSPAGLAHIGAVELCHLEIHINDK